MSRRFVLGKRCSRPWALGAGAISVVVSLASVALAEQTEANKGFEQGVKALSEGRPADAIAEFESLADQGIADGALSLDRALAYTARVKMGAGRPGDLGQAAHALEEARILAADPAIEKTATDALALVRAEIARRQARSGESVDLDRGSSLGWSIVGLASENQWAMSALVLSFALTLAGLIAYRASARRMKLAGVLGVALFGPVLLVLTTLTLAARYKRTTETAAVVVTPGARLFDERQVALASGASIAEGALVDILEQRSALARVRWGATIAWVQASNLRSLPRR